MSLRIAQPSENEYQPPAISIAVLILEVRDRSPEFTGMFAFVDVKPLLYRAELFVEVHQSTLREVVLP